MRVSEWAIREQMKHPKCEYCGVEIVIKPYHHYAKIPRFCHGHNPGHEAGGRASIKKMSHEDHVRGGKIGGSRRTNKQRIARIRAFQKWREEHPEMVHQLALESAKRLAEWSRKNPEQVLLAAAAAAEGIARASRTVEHRAKMSLLAKGKPVGFVTPKWREENWEKFLQASARGGREAARKNSITYPTMCERAMEKEFKLRKEPFESQKRVGPFIVDQFLSRRNTIVEEFGNYWHCNPKFYRADYFNTRVGITAKEIWERDQKRVEYLESLDYRVFRFWECDILEDVKICVNKVFGGGM